MNGRIQKDTSSLSELVRKAIIQMITTEQFESNRLPSEKKLGDRFGVSVAVVREALLLLSEEGVITKKQGSGNYFHLSVLKNQSELYKYQEFRELLEHEGYDVTESLEQAEVIVPGTFIRELLNLSEEDTVFHFTRVYRANGYPALICDNYLPMKLFRTKLELVDVHTEKFSLFDLFRDNMQTQSAYGQTQLYPYLTTEQDEERIGIEPGRAIILMDEEHFSYGDVPLSYSRIMLNDDYISINMIGR